MIRNLQNDGGRMHYITRLGVFVLMLIALLLACVFGSRSGFEFAIALLPAGFLFLLWRYASRRTKAEIASEVVTPPRPVWVRAAVVLTTIGGCLGCLALAIVQENSWHPVAGLPQDAKRVELGGYISCVGASDVPAIPDRMTAMYQNCQLMGDGGSLQVYVVLEDGRILGWDSGVYSMIDPHAPILKIFPMAIGAIIGCLIGVVSVSAIRNSISRKEAK